MNEYVNDAVQLFNWFDWVVVTIIGVSTLYGLFRGFIKEAVTVTAWALAAWLAYFYADPLSLYIMPQIETDSMRIAIMVLAMFVAVLTCSSMIRTGIRYVINKVGLSGLDYLLGAMFGIVRGVALTMLLMIALMNLGFSHDPWWKNSHMVKKIGHIMEGLSVHLPDGTKDIYVKYAVPKKGK